MLVCMIQSFGSASFGRAWVLVFATMVIINLVLSYSLFDMVLNTDEHLFYYFRLSTFRFRGKTENFLFWIDQINALIKFRYIHLEFDTYFFPEKVNWQTNECLFCEYGKKKCNEIMSRRSMITCCTFFPNPILNTFKRKVELMGKVRSSVVR